VVENMSYFDPPGGGPRQYIFGQGEGRKVAELFGVPFLGEIELDASIRIGGDEGKPVAAGGEKSPGAKSFYAIARNVLTRVEEVNAAATGPVVQID
jgi:ATP-binding protein involved in chromosome partitioning